MDEKKAKPEKPAGVVKAAKQEESAEPIYTGYDSDCFIERQDLLNAVQKLDQAGFFLEDVSCMHITEGFHLVYHFDRFDQPGRMGLRVVLDRENPEVDSISEIYPGASWHERECFDFFGVRFTGHPNLIPLLLDPDFEGPPPLLKEESALKDLNHLYPDRGHTGISPESADFTREINNCSNQKSRNKS